MFLPHLTVCRLRLSPRPYRLVPPALASHTFVGRDLLEMMAIAELDEFVRNRMDGGTPDGTA
jgi:hypothetical protein